MKRPWRMRTQRRPVERKERRQVSGSGSSEAGHRQVIN